MRQATSEKGKITPGSEAGPGTSGNQHWLPFKSVPLIWALPGPCLKEEEGEVKVEEQCNGAGSSPGGFTH